MKLSVTYRGLFCLPWITCIGLGASTPSEVVMASSVNVLGAAVSGSIFWLVCPVLLALLVLSGLALAALYRAPAADATKILSILADALVRIAGRASDVPAVDADGERGEHGEADSSDEFAPENAVSAEPATRRTR
jgi:hypothetical protein